MWSRCENNLVKFKRTFYLAWRKIHFWINLINNSLSRSCWTFYSFLYRLWESMLRVYVVACMINQLRNSPSSIVRFSRFKPCIVFGDELLGQVERLINQAALQFRLLHIDTQDLSRSRLVYRIDRLIDLLRIRSALLRLRNQNVDRATVTRTQLPYRNSFFASRWLRRTTLCT